MKTVKFLFCIAAALAGICWSVAQAQPVAVFSSKPVTRVVPFTASSGSDITACIIAPRFAERWGQPAVVDNRPGASGNLGAQRVTSAPPDGHTLLMAIDTFTMTSSNYKEVPFDAFADFASVAKLAEASIVFAINPVMPATRPRYIS